MKEKNKTTINSLNIVSKEEVATALGKSVAVIEAMVREGIIRAYKSNRGLYFDRRELEEDLFNEKYRYYPLVK